MTEPVSAQTTAAIESAIHIGEKLLASKRRLAAAVALLQFLERSFAAEIDGGKEIPGANAVDFLVPFIVDDVRPFLAALGDPRQPAFIDPGALLERVAQITAHRACCGTEHDPANGKLHGLCVVCGVPWPCSYAGAAP